MKKIYILLFFILSINIFAQNASDKLGSWYEISSSHKLAKKLRFQTLFAVVNYELLSSNQLNIIRVSGNYSVNNNFSFNIGYAGFGVGSYNTAGGIYSNNRVYLDLNFNNISRSLNFSQRIRLEKMFTYPESYLLRYSPKISFPINRKISGYIYDEIFFREILSYDQNWIGAGINYKINNTLKLNFGGMSMFNNSILTKIFLGLAITTK